MFVVTVRFAVKEEAFDAFLEGIKENAALSKEREEGCHHFDVCTAEGRTGEVFLYELYTDRAAFDYHLASDHFAAFSKLSEDMVIDKEIALYERVAS